MVEVETSLPTEAEPIATARLLIQLNRYQVSARQGVTLSGASGKGKTTALTQLGRAHELATRKRHLHDGARLPVIHVTVPSAATPKMLATEFARLFGLSFPKRGVTLTDIVEADCATAARVDLVLGDQPALSLAARQAGPVRDRALWRTRRRGSPATRA